MTVSPPATATEPRTLVLSWSGLLSLAYRRRIKRRDLAGALFYFGCTRTHVFDNGVGGELGEMQYDHHKDPGGVEVIYRMLKVIIRVAEADGRVIWRESGQSNSFDQLNELLDAHGLPAIRPQRRWDDYCYPGVHEIVEEQQLPYRVVSMPRHFA